MVFLPGSAGFEYPITVIFNLRQNSYNFISIFVIKYIHQCCTFQNQVNIKVTLRDMSFVRTFRIGIAIFKMMNFIIPS